MDPPGNAKKERKRKQENKKSTKKGIRERAKT